MVILKQNKMKHKIGDKVKIKSWDWYQDNNEDYGFRFNDEWFDCEMSVYCGQTAIISEVGKYYYRLKIDNSTWHWYDWMFEDDVVNETVKEPTINDSLKDKRFHAACCALQGMLANTNVDIFQHKDIAIEAYKHADQMLKQGGFYDNL